MAVLLHISKCFNHILCHLSHCFTDIKLLKQLFEV